MDLVLSPELLAALFGVALLAGFIDTDCRAGTGGADWQSHHDSPRQSDHSSFGGGYVPGNGSELSVEKFCMRRL
jgi:hypothetical protein